MYRSAAHACHGHVHSEATKIKHKGNKDKAYNYKKYYNDQEDQGQLLALESASETAVN